MYVCACVCVCVSVCVRVHARAFACECMFASRCTASVESVLGEVFAWK